MRTLPPLTRSPFSSGNGHPFVCFADISPNRGISPYYGGIDPLKGEPRKKAVPFRGRCQPKGDGRGDITHVKNQTSI